MKWYVVKIVFQIDINHGEHKSQFDESLRLVQATTLTEAFHLARSIGKASEEMFFNEEQKPVRWRFIDVCDVYPLETLSSGCEITSDTLVDERADEYVSMVKYKAILLQQRETILS
jgi:hypothetical protein